jgi:hypothetical protein
VDKGSYSLYMINTISHTYYNIIEMAAPKADKFVASHLPFEYGARPRHTRVWASLEFVSQCVEGGCGHCYKGHFQSLAGEEAEEATAEPDFL